MSKSKIFYFCFLIVFLILIIWRYQVIELRIKNSELNKYNDSDEEVVLVGTVVKEPDVRETSTKLTFKPEGIEARILVTVNRYPEYKYGDELKIIGKLQTPPILEGFDYKDYLKNKGIYSVIYWPKIEIIVRGRASGIYAKILDFKEKLRESIYQNISPPQSSILGAIILGDKDRMSNDLKEKLNIAGVRHITAVSGLHIVLISGILMSLLISFGFWRSQAIYISLAVLFLFIALTGFQVSSIRAGIMGGLFLIGQKIGRKSVSSRAIVMAAAVMLAINPLLLLHDVGFQLSFLAALGIIYLSVTFRGWLRFVPEIKLLPIRSILTMTFSAYLFTLPILIYNFGSISLVAPLTNILILPFIQWIMIFGFLFGLAGIFWSGLGWLLSFPCWFLLTYLIKIVDLFSQPWAARNISNLHWFWLLISYLVLGSFVWHIRQREKLKFLKY